MSESDTTAGNPVAGTEQATLAASEASAGENNSNDMLIPTTFTGFLWEVLMGSGDSPQTTAGTNGAASETKPYSAIIPVTESTPTDGIRPEQLVNAGPNTSDTTTAVTATPADAGLLATMWGYVPAVLTGSTASISAIQNEQPTVEEIIEINSKDPLADLTELPRLRLIGDDDGGYHRIMHDMSFFQQVFVRISSSYKFNDNQKIRTSLPRRFQDSPSWTLVFALEKHGISLRTFYDRCQQYCDTAYDGNNAHCPSLLIIRDSYGSVFGGFVTEMWRSNSGTGAVRESVASPQSAAASSRTLLRGASTRSYYGTGECFLFSVMAGSDVEIYQSTGKNDYFMLSEADFLALGGGDGKFSLFIDGDLYKGHSESAPTFNNQRPLCGGGVREDFTCVSMELWGINP